MSGTSKKNLKGLLKKEKYSIFTFQDGESVKNYFCQDCSNIKEHFEEKFKEINNNIQKLQDIIVKQNEVLMTCLAEQNLLSQKLFYRENTNKNVRSVFPIKSIDELNEVNQTISEDNQELYVNIMKILLKGRLPKTLTDVITTSVCMEVNVEGIHGKKRLKDFQAFFQALTDACRLLGSDDAEKDIRNALKIIKKRQIHADCIKNKRKNNLSVNYKWE